MLITNETKVGQIAAEHPMATRVFARHGIDFCCGGGRPLQDVCERKGLDVESILYEIRAELTEDPSCSVRWDRAELGDLIDHIITAYHRPLSEERPRLELMARKVNRAHGDKMPDVLPELLSTFVELKAELDAHMMKEEQILFPLIRSGQGARSSAPMSVMEHEHESAGRALERLRHLTNDYTAPEGACNTWRALWVGLEQFETDMHEHIHLENNILFPRARMD